MALPKTLSAILDTKEFYMLTGTTFRGLSITERSDGWNVVVRAFLDNGQAVYVLTLADCPHEGLERLLEAISYGTGDQLWRHDKFYSNGG